MREPLRLIPAIDLRGGHCVRLLHGNFAAETRYAASASELLDKYLGFGADWLHIVDLDGAKDGSGLNREMIFALAARTAKRSLATRGLATPGVATPGVATPGLQLQVGGGLRQTHDVETMLQAGVARVVIGSAAVGQVELVRGWLHDFGAERMTLAFDVRLDPAGVPRVATHGWRQQSPLSLWEAMDAYSASGLRHVLCTDVARDGALSGPNLALYEEAAARYPQIAWQASGGIRNARDLRDLSAAGAAAAISGKALLEELIPLAELRPFLPNA